MYNPEAQRIPARSDVDKARDEIKRKLVESGGKWLISPMIYDQDVCHYFSLYCADKLMKGELLTEQEFSKESFLAAAKKYGSVYDSEILDLHKKIKETEGIQAHYSEILRLINILHMLANSKQVIVNRQYNMQLIASKLNSQCDEYSKEYDEVFSHCFGKIINSHNILKIENELLPCLSIRSFQNEIVKLQHKKAIVDGGQLIPTLNETTLILIRDKCKYRYISENNEHKLVNMSCAYSHYIAISFLIIDDLPTLFIIDASFGVIKFQNINEFANGLSFLLSFYNKKFTHSNLILWHLNNTANQPKKLMKSSDWQAAFCIPTTHDDLPTSSLRQQINIPNWAKEISTYLQEYEESTFDWSKVEIVSSLQRFLNDKNVLMQIYSDLKNMKSVQPIFAQLKDQLKSYLAQPSAIINEAKNDVINTDEKLIARKNSPP